MSENTSEIVYKADGSVTISAPVAKAEQTLPTTSTTTQKEH